MQRERNLVGPSCVETILIFSVRQRLIKHQSDGVWKRRDELQTTMKQGYWDKGALSNILDEKGVGQRLEIQNGTVTVR